MSEETKKQKVKLIITGYSDHGKDTVCEILRLLGLNFKSSSIWMLENHLWEDRFLDTKSGISAPCINTVYGAGYSSPKKDYTTLEEMYADRDNHRGWWKDYIKEINLEKGLHYLGSKLLTEFDVYCGLRDYEEMEAIKSWVKHEHPDWKLITGFVDATPRKTVCKADREGALTILKSDCDLVITNDLSKITLIERVVSLYKNGYFADIPIKADYISQELFNKNIRNALDMSSSTPNIPKTI